MSNIKPMQPNRPTPTNVLELRPYGWMHQPVDCSLHPCPFRLTYVSKLEVISVTCMTALIKNHFPFT